MRAITLAAYQILLGTQPGFEPSIPAIRPPAGTYRLNFFAVTTNGIRQDPATRIAIAFDYTFDPPGAGERRWYEQAGVETVGEAGLRSGGILNGDDGDIVASVSTHWDFCPRDSAGTGPVNVVTDPRVTPAIEVPLALAYFRPRYRILAGDPSGAWISLIACAEDVAGNPLEFDLSTKG